jgi:trigger factor
VKSVVEPLEGNKVKLSITVDADEFEPAIDAAWKAIAQEVRIPGFRTGKVPRKVLETRIEPGYARSEALQQALPDYYVRAVREHDVDVIAQPEIDITAGQDDGDVSFDAVVEIRPEITIRGYEDLTIEVPSPAVSDEDVDAQIDRIRGQYGEIVAVERPAAAGDYVSIDIAGTRDGEEVEGLTAEDYLYEVGAGSIVPELDEQLEGAAAGDELEFDADHPDPAEDEQVHFSVTVKEVKERVLPDLTDEWVADATEFSTIEELRADVATRTAAVKKSQASMALQSKLGDALVELVIDEVPEALVGTEMRSRLEDLVHRLSHQGITLEQYLQFTNTPAEQFTADLRETAVGSAKVDLALRAIAAAEGLLPSDEELDEEIEKIAAQLDVDAELARRQLEENDQLGSVRSDLGNRAALRWLTERVTIVDEEGNPVSRDELEVEAPEPDEHDHDHDHDHDHGDDHDHEH